MNPSCVFCNDSSFIKIISKTQKNTHNTFLRFKNTNIQKSIWSNATAHCNITCNFACLQDRDNTSSNEQVVHCEHGMGWIDYQMENTECLYQKKSSMADIFCDQTLLLEKH